MIAIPAENGVRAQMLSFRRGDYIVEALREFLKTEGVDAALITSGIGSLDICRLHTIKHTGLPPEDVHFELRGPIEIGSMLGSVAGGEPHIHVTVHDTVNNQTHVGHLEPGSRCCYRVELGLLIFEGVRTKRLVDPWTNLIDIVRGEDNG